MSSHGGFSCFLVGGQSRLIQCGEILLEKGHAILGVISPDVSVLQWAEGRNLKTIPPTGGIIEVLKKQPFDYLFSIDNFSILPGDIINLPSKFAINFHDGPLPRYAGSNVTSWALMNQEQTHGITWHVMTEGADKGDILKQEVFHISEGETAFSMNMKCFEKSTESFSELVDELSKKTFKRIHQDVSKRTFYALWKRPPAACTVDFTRPAEEISALFRGLNFGTYPNRMGLPKIYVGEQVIIAKQIEIQSTNERGEPGTISHIKELSVEVGTETNKVVFRNFCTVDGDEFLPSGFFRKRGLHVGDKLPALPEERAEIIARINSEACRHEAFWADRLALLEPVEVPYFRWKTTRKSDVVGYLEARFSTAPASVSELRSREKVGDILLAAHVLYLARISGMERFDIAFRDLTLGKFLSGSEAFFACHVPLRVKMDFNKGFEELISTIEREEERVTLHKSYARDLVLRYPQLRESPVPKANGRLPVAISRVENLGTRPPIYGAGMEIIIPDNGEECIWLYDQEILDSNVVEKMRNQFLVLLRQIYEKKDKPLAELSVVSEEAKKKLLIEFNETNVDYQLDKCLHEFFEDQVERTPDAVAVVFKGKQLTYRELNRRANQLAHHLRSLGVGPETLVGVYMERSLEMVIGLYGILKGGGAYVPLDPEYPAERISFMLENTQVPVLLTQKHLEQYIPGHSAKLINVDSEWEMIARESEDNLETETKPHNLAYVIYTSGSTGRPKGVMNIHRGICNRLLWMQDAYKLSHADRVLQKTTFSFDVSVWEFFWPLLFGATLVVAEPGGHRDTGYLTKTIVDEDITTMHFVPSMLQVFLEDKDVRACKSLKRVICSGEALPYDLQERFFELLNAELHNLYGPTEAAVDVTYWACQRGSRLRTVPIGRPIANTQTYILDKYMQPVPIGVSGELHLGGVQIARGYLNRPDLTSEKFIPDPFSPEAEARLYKTGDLCRYLPDGNIEYLGRNDFQVKIRGQRIEIGEIESVLAQYPAVREVVVLAREDVPGDKRLVAYIVPKQQSKLDVEELRNSARDKLPSYMVPAAIVLMDAFPLTSSGKVDRRSLPIPERKRQKDKSYVAPQGELERILAGIWEELLQVDKVGVRDNFFDLGGHSLLLVKMVPKLEKAFGRKVSIIDLFQRPNIKAMAEFLSDERKGGPSFDRIQERGMKQREMLKSRKQTLRRRGESQ
jgi:amino acid adenylation domain-containing protein